MPNMELIVKFNSFWFIPLQMTHLALENNIYVQNVQNVKSVKLLESDLIQQPQVCFKSHRL